MLTAHRSPTVVQKRGEAIFVELPEIPGPAARGKPAERSKAQQRPGRGSRTAHVARAEPPPSARAQSLAAREAIPSALPEVATVPRELQRVASAPKSEAPPAARPAERAAPVPPAEPSPARPEAPVAHATTDKPAPLPRTEPRSAAPESTPGAGRPALVGPPEPHPQQRRDPRVVRSDAPIPEAIKEPPAISLTPERRVTTVPRPESAVATPPAESSSSPSAPPTTLRRAEPSVSSGPGGDRLAALRPQSRGGGLRDGRGGIEGEPIPLDTKDPKFSDYMERVRKQIKENWVYPREAAEKNIGGSLMMEFGIAKDGQLRFIELRRSSGVPVLDDYAVNAVKLAQPFPPIPDRLSRTGIPIAAVFNYIIDIGALNNFVR